MSHNRVSVMVVEDSPLSRELLTLVLNGDPRLRVDCAVDCAETALRLLPGLAPDVISMDIRLPGIDGIEATRRIMADCPTPIVVVAARLPERDHQQFDGGFARRRVGGGGKADGGERRCLFGDGAAAV